jgi:Flp pilus assembly protein TadG
MRKLRNESGQTLVFVAVGISVLLGFAAFATDIGIMLHEQNLAQHAADSAAIAGATRLHYPSSVVTTAALNDAAQNGFTNGVNGVTVTVIDSPSASDTGNAAFTGPNFVKVTISKDTPGFFMKAFNRTSMTVSASAVATNAARSTTCFYILDPSDPYSMQLQGSFYVNAPSCSFQINSSSGDALHFNGTNGHLTAQTVNVVGGASGQTGDSTPAPTLGVAPLADPLAWEAPPSGYTCSGTAGTTYTIAGTSTNQLTIGPTDGGTVCYNGNVTLSNVVLSPGTYVFPNGNVSLAGKVNGTGVTLFLGQGNLSATTNSVLNLTAPGSGDYSGLLIFNDSPLASTPHQVNLEPGNATGYLQGIIYAPYSQLYIHDSGGDTSGGNTLTFNVDFVVYQFSDQTGVLTITPYTPTDASLSFPLTSVTLVE